MRKLIVFSLPLLLTNAAAGVFSFYDPLKQQEGNGLSAGIQAFVADDPVSLSDLLDNWHGEFHPEDGTNLAIDDVRTDIGATYGEFGYLGYTYRHQSFTAANRDTVLLIWQQLNDTGFIPGKRYDLDISIDGFEADGILYSNAFDIIDSDNKHLKIGLGFELLRGRNMQHGYLQGYATANSSKDYDFSAVSDYYYTENYLYNLDVEKADGFGYSTHISMEYDIEDISLRLLANDIFGRIRWKRLPYSYVNINSSNKSYDENGFVVYNPTVSGVEKYLDHTQKLYAKWRAEASYGQGETIYTAGTDFVKERWFPYITASNRFTNDFAAALGYDFRFSTLGVDVAWRELRISLKSDSIKDPSSIGVSISYRMLF
ncbi:hypothetical protein NNO_0378 [Hydrogenimonas sp.]|nr:hypothetical protein NNO_0378 [Hydrogenimonas sp.]